MEQTQPINNNLVWAILSTIFCCLPTGIYAIILASKVDGLVAAGNLAEAREKADAAKKWSIYGAIACAILAVLYVLLFVVIGVANNAH